VAPPDEVPIGKIVTSGLRPPVAALPLFARSGWLVLSARRSKQSKGSEATALKDHLDQVKAVAKHITHSLGVPSHLATVVMEAAAQHDVGKSHHGFQRFLGNADQDKPVAKSAKPVGGRSPFRHEALSVLIASVADDLTRHVIGTHHGYGRPVFDPTVRVPHAGSDQLTAADGTWLQNFGQLSNELNPWALAWLESLVRAADAQASAEPAIVEEEAP